VREFLVVLRHFLARQVQRNDAAIVELAVKIRALPGRQLLSQAGPSNPESSPPLVAPAHAGCQPTRRLRKRDPIGGRFDRDRQAVRDNQEARHPPSLARHVPMSWPRAVTTINAELAELAEPAEKRFVRRI